MGFPDSPDSKESACNVGVPGSIPELGRSHGDLPPTPEFLLGEAHGQRRRVGYSPW